MTTQRTSSAAVNSRSRTSDIAGPPQFKYFGKDAVTGAYRIKSEYARYWIQGVAVKGIQGAKRQTFLTGTCPEKSVVLIARGHKTNKPYLVQGLVIKHEVLGFKRAAITPKDTADTYRRDLERISAARSAGADPHVSIEFISHHVQRSKASVYRDVESARLPKPIKVGRSSTWPFSAVDLYARGLPTVSV